MSGTPARKGHVKRVMSNDGASWVDVLRIDQTDVSSSTVGDSVQGQITTLQFKWIDSSGEGKNTGREYEIVSVVPNSGSPINVTAVKSMNVLNSGQGAKWFFNNSPDNTARKVTRRRVYHVDGTPDATTPVDWATYEAALKAGTKDMGNYVDVEFVDAFSRINSGQEDKFFLNNKGLETLFDDGATTGCRLDPFQMIVNVSPQQATQRYYVSFAQSGVFMGEMGPTNVGLLHVVGGDGTLAQIGLASGTDPAHLQTFGLSGFPTEEYSGDYIISMGAADLTGGIYNSWGLAHQDPGNDSSPLDIIYTEGSNSFQVRVIQQQHAAPFGTIDKGYSVVDFSSFRWGFDLSLTPHGFKTLYEVGSDRPFSYLTITPVTLV